MVQYIDETVLQRTIAFVDTIKKAIETGDKTTLVTICRACNVNTTYPTFMLEMKIISKTEEGYKWITPLPVATVARKLILKARRYAHRMANNRKPRKPHTKKVTKAMQAALNPTHTKPKLTSVDSVIKLVDIAHRYGVKEVNALVKEMMNGVAKEAAHV